MSETGYIFLGCFVTIVVAYLWWINKDRKRANTYQGEAEQAKEYRAAAADHMKRTTEHMERIETSLDRIAAALEAKKQD